MGVKDVLGGKYDCCKASKASLHVRDWARAVAKGLMCGNYTIQISRKAPWNNTEGLAPHMCFHRQLSMCAIDDVGGQQDGSATAFGDDCSVQDGRAVAVQCCLISLLKSRDSLR